ncbi:cytochrome P450 [Pseudooceanicola sp. C21-150M6]
MEAAFTDRRLGNAPSRFSVLAEKNRGQSVAADLCANIPPFLDMPRHADLRRPLSAAFHATFAGSADWLGALAEEELDGQAAEFDVVADFAGPFAARAMARFLGLAADAELMRRSSAALFRLFAPITSRSDLAQADADLARARRAMTPVAGGAGLIAAMAETGAMTDQEIADNAILVLADGIENIEAAVALVLLTLERVPQLRDDWLGGRLGTAEMLPEALRLNSPAQIIPRVVRDGHDRHGIRLEVGTPLFLALGSANLDPDAFDGPEKFDATRADPGRYVFGRGRHSCIGAPLARAMIAAALEALRQRGVGLAGQADRVRYHRRFGHRWPEALPVRLEGARAAG